MAHGAFSHRAHGLATSCLEDDQIATQDVTCTQRATFDGGLVRKHTPRELETKSALGHSVNASNARVRLQERPPRRALSVLDL
jgi:hypothetical protein